ncbi:cysteine hydrolase family protein [Lichenihabitans psoromatis]|uniref:cysteine hydrolase family protein n=1 Tax=Lichenihabitans psoromatis TaxID=2528642 RepID=UPI001035AA30|nr:cysteine hydrolase family protein [Lichenihabitans psoromatis]
MTTALLIIDVQNAILAGLANGPRQAVIDDRLDEVAARLGRLKRDAEAAGIPVILVQHDGEAGHRLNVGTAGWQFRDEIAPHSDTIVVHKRSCDAFHDTSLGQRLDDLKIDHLIIGGCMSQFCVDTTTRRAVSLGFDVTLLEDGHATFDFGALKAEQIVHHHNQILSGFEAGSKTVRVVPVEAVKFRNVIP